MLGTATLATRYYSRKVTVTVLSAYVVYSTIYRIAGNFCGDFNLANWRIFY